MAEASSVSSKVPGPEPEISIVETSPRIALSTTPSTPVQQIFNRSDDGDSEPPSKRSGMKSIRINIHIEYPEDIFPKFRNRKFHFGCRNSNKKRRFHPLLKLIIALFYISFIVCGAVSWHLKNRWSVRCIPVAVLVIMTFIPFFDLFGNIAILRLIKKHQENPKQPKLGPLALIVLQFNTVLLIAHIVFMTLAITWMPDQYYWQYWYTKEYKKAIIGMTMHSTISMILFKVILALRLAYWLKHPHKKNPSGYEELAQDAGEQSEDEQTPRNSNDRVRLL